MGGSFSFAKMLRQGVAKPSAHAAPVKSTLMSVVAKATKNDDSEPEPEDYVPPPPKASLGDALAQAFEQAKTTSSGNNSTFPDATTAMKKSSKKSKKMKGQKISLTGSASPIMD